MQPQRHDIQLTPLLAVLNYTIEDCEFARRISTSSLIQTLRVVHVVACMIGLLSGALFIYILSNRAANHLHINVRISLISMSVGAILACLQLWIMAMYSLYRSVTKLDACSFMVDAWTCSFLRFPIIFAVYSTIFGSFVLAAERSVATIKYKTYEAHGSVYVGVILITFQWMISLVLTSLYVWMRHLPGHVHYCSVYVSKPESALHSIITICVVEICALILFLALLHINKRKRVTEFLNNSLHSLTERYQLQENIRMMQILIPTITVQVVLSVSCFLALILFALFSSSIDSESVVSLAPFSEFILLFIAMYGALFPIVATMRNVQLRQTTKRALPCLFPKHERRPTGNVDEEVKEGSVDGGRKTTRSSRLSRQEIQRDSDRHFGLLTEMWKK